MKFLQRLSSLIDQANRGLAAIALLAVLVMTLVGAFNALARKLFSYGSNAFIELQWYCFAVAFLFGAAYALKEDAHVRVDVIFARLPERPRLVINLLGHALLLLPFCVISFHTSLDFVIDSWESREMSADAEGLPRAPIKTVIPIAFFFLALQGFSEIAKTLLKWQRKPETRAEENIV